MKRIIWVFGESATGKKTFIQNILNQNQQLLEEFELEGLKIDVIRHTIEPHLEAFDNKNAEEVRSKKIIEGINTFVKSDKDVLLIKGQANDMDERYGNTLLKVANLYPNIGKEILLLEVYNLDELYSRFINKDWYLEDVERYSKMFPREWLDKAVERHRAKVLSFKKVGYSIGFVDSTNGFSKNVKEEKTL